MPESTNGVTRLEPSANQGGLIQFIRDERDENFRLMRERFDEYTRRYLAAASASYTATATERTPSEHGIRITGYDYGHPENGYSVHPIGDPSDPDDDYWPEECIRISRKPKTREGIARFYDAHPELRGIV